MKLETRRRSATAALLLALVTAVVALGTVPAVAAATATAASGPTAGTGGARAGAPGAAGGDWRWPLAGTPVVTREFQRPLTRFSAGHRGVDLAAVPGQPVLAAGAGAVGFAGMVGGRGVVTVVHGELRTTYEPVTASVVAGQQVGAGDQLGAVAAGHASCLPGQACLHWGLRRGEEYLDPLALLGRPRVRLLPLDTAVPAAAAQPAATGPALPRPPGGNASGPEDAVQHVTHSAGRSAASGAGLTVPLALAALGLLLTPIPRLRLARRLRLGR